MSYEDYGVANYNNDDDYLGYPGRDSSDESYSAPNEEVDREEWSEEPMVKKFLLFGILLFQIYHLAFYVSNLPSDDFFISNLVMILNTKTIVQ